MKNWIYLAVIAFSIQAVSAQKYYLQCGNVFDPTSERYRSDQRASREECFSTTKRFFRNERRKTH